MHRARARARAATTSPEHGTQKVPPTVAVLLEEEIGHFVASLSRTASDAGANPFKVGLFSDAEIAAHRAGRSVDSRLGNALEHLLFRLAASRYPDACPTTILGEGVTADMVAGLRTPRGSRYRPGRPKPVVWSKLPERVVRAAAARLTDHIHRTGERIGSDAFSRHLTEARATVREAPRAADPWPAVSDFWCARPELGFAEVKAGGNLDNTKARVEVEELIRTALIVPDPSVQPRVLVCYATKGSHGVAGSLSSYLEPSHLLAGEDVWSRVLPSEVSFADFLGAYQDTSRRLRADAG